MTDTSAVIYGLETRARALTQQYVMDSDIIRFLVGTQSFRGNQERGSENQIHLVEYDDESSTTRKNVFHHNAGEIWHMTASNSNPCLVATCYNKISSDNKSEMRACIWKLPEDSANEDPLEDDGVVHDIEKLVELNSNSNDITDVKCVIWSPNEDNNDVISLSDTKLYLWNIDHSASAQARLKGTCTLEGKGHPRFTTCRWDPHHRSTQIATANDCCIRGWDLRSFRQTYAIENAHGQLIRDLDFNPNRQYIIASCGDDCRTKFWDVRNATKPLKVLDEHSHWVWSVRFNQFHDQLVLTASSDSKVILNNLSSISSEPFGKLIEEIELDDDDGDDGADDGVGEDSVEKITEKPRTHSKQPVQDNVVQIFEEHEDSVYAVEWSAADPWVFASLSYDGRLVINHVPRTEKYSILL